MNLNEWDVGSHPAIKQALWETRSSGHDQERKKNLEFTYDHQNKTTYYNISKYYPNLMSEKIAFFGSGVMENLIEEI